MNSKFAIGIPTVNRADLLNDSLKRYVEDFPQTQIYICDNGQQNIFTHPNISITVQTENLGVAKSWNFLCNKIFESSDYAIIINDDVYWGKNENEVIKYICDNNGEGIIVAPGTWCNFILPKRTFDEIGPFDEGFVRAYYEDNDYHYRMKLANKSYLPTPFMSPLVYRNSQSIAKDPGLNNNFGHNKQRYIDKWGGTPGDECFATPFNNPK